MILRVRIPDLPDQRAVFLRADETTDVLVRLCGTDAVRLVPYTDICGVELQPGIMILFEVTGRQVRS